MAKVFMFSDLFLPTFPYLEMPMYKYIKSLGIEVQYVLQDKDIRLTDSVLSQAYKSINTMTITNSKQLAKLMTKDDLLLMRFAYKGFGADVAQRVRDSKYKILMYDPSGIDIRVRACPAQYLTSKSYYLRQETLKKFPNQYKQVFTTGTIHYDAAAITHVDRDNFMSSYGLDPSKKFVLVTPANPGEMGHQAGIDNEYSQIIDVVKSQCLNYEIAVKAHPLDYTANMKAQPGIVHKNEHYNGKHSWDKFAPGITVIKAEEGYKAIRACDAILNVRSSIAMETCLFPKPLININRKKYTTNWPFAKGVMMDIELSELANVLNNNLYQVDINACKKYCEEHCLSDDGLAYKRTGDIALKIIKGEV